VTQLICEQTSSEGLTEPSRCPERSLRDRRPIALLTAGRDKPYALGMACALLASDVSFDFIGSDLVDGPELHGNPLVRFLKLRDQRSDTSGLAKGYRVLAYYCRLIHYAASAEPRVFHILWNNKIEFFDRTILMLYYKLLGKRVVLTVHNVNVGKRDSTDSFLNRLSLRIQYWLTDHIFVHTEKMKSELALEFGVPEGKATVIPFGINNTVPNTSLSTAEAKRQIGLASSDKAILFFGHIAPYKGLHYLIAALAKLVTEDTEYHLIIAGNPKWSRHYWDQVQEEIKRKSLGDFVIERIEYIPDEQAELYFKGADVLILPCHCCRCRVFKRGDY
jgi:glycosyltransferase involved in cell wall biosynthesis